MKCPKCDARIRNKEFTGDCPECHYHFVFGTADSVSDRKFEALLRKASANDTYYFTENQLYSLYARSQHMSPAWVYLPGILMILLAAWIMGSVRLYLIFLPFLALPLVAILARKIRKPPSRTEFQKVLSRWRSAHPIPRLLQEDQQRLLHPPPALEKDIYDYGVEKILIVERPILVDLLVLNDFAAREKALVVSEDGYPSYLQPRLAAILKEQQDIKIHLLHDATEHGESMQGRLEKQRPEFEGHGIVDLGISTRDAKKTKLLSHMVGGEAGYRMPVDFLGPAALATMAGIAMSMNTSMLAAQQTDTSGGGTSYG